MATTALAPLDVSMATPCLDIPPATWGTLSPSTSTLPPLPAPTPAPPSRLQFSSLPLEIRDLIWEHTLPPPRLFHKTSSSAASSTNPPPPNRPPHRRFRLSYPAPSPPKSAPSRAAPPAALASSSYPPPPPTAGPANPHPPLVQPRADIVYIDRSLRTTLVHERGQPEFAVVGFERVQHVAVEWRWVTSNGSVPLGNYADQPMLDLLGQRVASLYAYMPALATLHYILPLVRCDLVDLPPRITIPLESGHRPWGDVRDALVNAISAESSVQYWLRCFGDRGSYPPTLSDTGLSAMV
ncbi:unnamed protein product [Parascedosporium putredinis]|uniref:2EXR domain-containing protein n=1 Tax=Parascedosporium putredinis TaxID=1442378 RepID=A0A9P1M9K4_9PEZI|nr:unnamed protein product [Parascedosporium putredinis]CAI7995804.1 unnamed protein product [Parascedosporium putredinis]